MVSILHATVGPFYHSAKLHFTRFFELSGNLPLELCLHTQRVYPDNIIFSSLNATLKGYHTEYGSLSHVFGRRNEDLAKSPSLVGL